MARTDIIWEVPTPTTYSEADGAWLQSVAEACMSAEGIEGAGFDIRFVDGPAIRDLNRRMRGIDAETDVLSFPTVRFPKGRTARSCPGRLRREYIPSEGRVHLGDCAINIDRARAQAAEYGHSLRREIAYLTAHSAFHLMGYDHMNEEDKRIMRDMEEKALGSLGISRDEAIDFDALFAEACEAMKLAYCPYSRFQVGACILAEDGRTFRGCNFENASYGASICAERCATGNAVVNGARRFRAVAIVGSSAVAWPCGICRQVLSEFAAPSMPVVVGEYGKGYVVKTLGELLPESFTPAALGIVVSD